MTLTGLAILLVVVFMMAAGLIAGRETCGVLLRRWMLSSDPVPRKTRIVVPDGDRFPRRKASHA